MITKFLDKTEAFEMVAQQQRWCFVQDTTSASKKRRKIAEIFFLAYFTKPEKKKTAISKNETA